MVAQNRLRSSTPATDGLPGEESLYFWGNGENGAIDTVTQQGDTMTWLVDIPTGGQARMAWVLESQDIMTLKSEMAEEGGDWVVAAEYRFARVR